MPSLDCSIEVEIWCGRCGAGICNNASQKRGKQGFSVDPFHACLKEEHDDAYDAGYEEGVKVTKEEMESAK